MQTKRVAQPVISNQCGERREESACFIVLAPTRISRHVYCIFSPFHGGVGFDSVIRPGIGLSLLQYYPFGQLLKNVY